MSNGQRVVLTFFGALALLIASPVSFEHPDQVLTDLPWSLFHLALGAWLLAKAFRAAPNVAPTRDL